MYVYILFMYVCVCLNTEYVPVCLHMCIYVHFTEISVLQYYNY